MLEFGEVCFGAQFAAGEFNFQGMESAAIRVSGVIPAVVDEGWSEGGDPELFPIFVIDFGISTDVAKFLALDSIFKEASNMGRDFPVKAYGCADAVDVIELFLFFLLKESPEKAGRGVCEPWFDQGELVSCFDIAFKESRAQGSVIATEITGSDFDEGSDLFVSIVPESEFGIGIFSFGDLDQDIPDTSSFFPIKG